MDRVRRMTGVLTGSLDHIFTLKQIGEKTRKKERRVYVDFMDLEKAYDRVNREALRQVLSIYDMSGKLLNGIKIMYVNSLNLRRSKRR